MLTYRSELSCALVVRFRMVEPAHSSSSPKLGMGARIYLKLFQDLTGDVLSVIRDVPVNSEASVVTSSTSRYVGPSISEVLIGVGCACVCS